MNIAYLMTYFPPPHSTKLTISIMDNTYWPSLFFCSVPCAKEPYSNFLSIVVRRFMLVIFIAMCYSYTGANVHKRSRNNDVERPEIAVIWFLVSGFLYVMMRVGGFIHYDILYPFHVACVF